MRTFFIYLRLELKRALKSIPYFLAGAIVLVLLAGTVAFSASKMLYGEQALAKIQVGVVLPQDDKLAAKAISMVTSLDSVGSLCEFTYVEEEEGRELLKKGELLALMVLPQGLIQGIIDGTNVPVDVLLPEHAGLESSVFKELTDAGSSILGTAQAAIYGTDEFLRLHLMEEEIPQAERELNAIYMKYALSRSAYFRTEQTSAAGDVSTVVFYGISASVLVLLLLGIPAAPIVRPYSAVMEQKLTLIGIGRMKRTAVRTLALAAPLILVSAAPFFWCLWKGWMNGGVGSFFVWIFLCLAAAGWILFLYELCGSITAGILALFFTTAFMVFLSGGIVPSVFLPDAAAGLGRFMPTTFLMDGVRWMLQGGEPAPAVRLVLMEGVVFLLSSAVRRDYE